MIISIGLDLVELDRIQKAWDRFGLKFAQRILTPLELEDLPRRPVSFLAARFAGKEAGVKALGTGFSHGISFHSLGIQTEASGKPWLTFYDQALIQAEKLGVARVHLSLTHGRDTACAVVVLEK
ncbi:MAG: holo-[acyl-carrier-protein] synthase [Desulfohalobiaceae bacterium]|nr:holo-[acyl-carrier-protein] synthase [Desulfohalobiaceae bacterium]